MKLSDVRICSPNDYFSEDTLILPDAYVHSIGMSALSAYYVLKDLFGPPNVKTTSEISQWEYFLQAPESHLEVSDWRRALCMVSVYADSNDETNARRIGNEFLDLLKKQAHKSGQKIKQAAKSTNRYVIQNPFPLYYRSATRLLEKAQKSNEDSQDYCRSAFFLFIASSEGLLNLIYELYLKPELRDDRIYERLAREQIDIKVRLAPLYCDCFSGKLIDHNSDVFKRFHSIVNLRNDFIHANFTQPMRNPIIIEDGYTFVLEQSKRDKNELPKSIDALNKKDVGIIKESIDQMIDLLTEGMKPRFRREFRRILQQEYVQITIEDGETIVVESE